MGVINRLLTRSKLLHRTSQTDSSGSISYNSLLDQSPPITFDSAHLPILPIEIWRRILASVCRLPGAVCYDPPDPFSVKDVVPVSSSEERSNARDKRVLQLVCRAWYLITLELVYETLVLCCPKHSIPLINAIEKSKDQDDEGRGHGWWTREIKFRSGSCSEGKSKAPATLRHIDILRLLRCTPNLAIYINDNWRDEQFGRRTHPTVLNALGKYCGRSLLRLEWSGSECPRWDDMEMLLFLTPNLQTLSIQHVWHPKVRPDPDEDHRVPLVLPALRTLSLGTFPTPIGISFPLWDPALATFIRSKSPSPLLLSQPPSKEWVQLPSLTSLSITPISIASPNTPTERFLRRHGQQLHFLRTTDITPKDPGETILDWTPIHPTLLTLLDFCPQLRSLIFNPLQPILHPLGHPRLERIAIFPPFEEPMRAQLVDYAPQIERPVDALFEHICGGDFPRLRVLRLKDRGPFAFLGESALWVDRWRPVWEARGVRFEDYNGLDFTFAVEGGMETMPEG